MPLLFFALASASSEQPSHNPCASLALHAGSNGWQSARFCTYPQELLLELEKGAEIHEVEIAVRDFAPSSVEVFLSSDKGFQHACTLEMNRKKVRQKMFLLCSGQVKLLLHEPLPGPSNPYKQVALASVDLWGYEDVLPKKTIQGELDLGEEHDEIASVLMDLGVPLSLVPVDEDSSSLAGLAFDPKTKALVKELRSKEDVFLEQKNFGGAQQLEEHVQQLYKLGEELYKLQQEREEYLKKLKDFKDFKDSKAKHDVQRVSQRISELEEKRLHVAAFYETDWWLSAMALPISVPLGETPESISRKDARDAERDSTTGHTHRDLAFDSTQKPVPVLAQGMRETPKSARNTLPVGFGTGRSHFAEEASGNPLSTARSQP